MKDTDWKAELYKLDISDPDSKGCTIALGEYLRIDCPELEQFIQSLLSKQRLELIKEMEGVIGQPEPIGKLVELNKDTYTLWLLQTRLMARNELRKEQRIKLSKMGG